MKTILSHWPIPAKYAVLIPLVLLAGCEPRKIPCDGFRANLDPTPQAGIGTINVSIDGSGSMKGFSAVPGSTYQTTLEELDNTVGINSALGFAKSTTNVWRIGREAKSSLKSAVPASILAARTADFFEPKQGSWPKVSSMIDQFVSQNDPYSLDLLISDLEPDNASIKQVLSAILPKLRHQQKRNGLLPWQKQEAIGNELAIIGIRSQFSGGVFPVVQGYFPSFPYTGVRPFYILALGPAPKVEVLVDRIIDNKKIGPYLQVTRFAANPGNGKTIFVSQAQTTLVTPNCMRPVFSISQGLSGKLQLQDSRNRWLVVQRVKLCTANNLSIKFGTPAIPGFGASIIDDPGSIVSNTVDIRSAEISAKGLLVTTQFSVPSRTINLIDISADSAKIDQQVWADWSTSGTLMEGDKTQRLLPFLQSLRDETDQAAKAQYGVPYSPVRICAAVKS